MDKTFYQRRHSDRGWPKRSKERKAKREKLGLSQEMVGSRLGVRGATVCRWESGCIRPNDAMERAWDDALYAEAK